MYILIINILIINSLVTNLLVFKNYLKNFYIKHDDKHKMKWNNEIIILLLKDIINILFIYL